MSRRSLYTAGQLHKANKKIGTIIRLHGLVNSRTSGPLHGNVRPRLLVFLYFTKSVELVDGDHRGLRPFVSGPTFRPQGRIEGRRFPLFLRGMISGIPFLPSTCEACAGCGSPSASVPIHRRTQRAEVQPQKSSAVCRGYLYYREGW